MARNDPNCPYHPARGGACPHHRATARWPEIACRCQWDEWFATHPSRWQEVTLITEHLRFVGIDEALCLEAAVIAVRDYDPERCDEVTHYASMIAERLRQGLHGSREMPLDVDVAAKSDDVDAHLDAGDMLLKLTELEQEVLKLRFVYKLTYQQIGGALGVCKSRAWAVIREALRKMRED